MENLTPGQYAVGISFNPSSDERVHTIKMKFAEILDYMNEIQSDDNIERFYETAIDEIITAQMRAVKAITSKKM